MPPSYLSLFLSLSFSIYLSLSIFVCSLFSLWDVTFCRSGVRAAVPAGQPGQAGGGRVSPCLRADNPQDQMPGQEFQKVSWTFIIRRTIISNKARKLLKLLPLIFSFRTKVSSKSRLKCSWYYCISASLHIILLFCYHGKVFFALKNSSFFKVRDQLVARGYRADRALPQTTAHKGVRIQVIDTEWRAEGWNARRLSRLLSAPHLSHLLFAPLLGATPDFEVPQPYWMMDFRINLSFFGLYLWVYYDLNFLSATPKIPGTSPKFP